MPYTRNDCISALRSAYREIGHSPTIREYQQTAGKPSADTIQRLFGGWNATKEAAGLKQYLQNHEIEEKPADVDLPEDLSWKGLSPYQRYYYRNRTAEKERTRRRVEETKQWFQEYKATLVCERCGEDHPACLDFHHTADKDSTVTALVSRRNASKERIKREINKCKVLCANCHRKLHAGD